jgi:hypothetical protein
MTASYLRNTASAEDFILAEQFKCCDKIPPEILPTLRTNTYSIALQCPLQTPCDLLSVIFPIKNSRKLLFIVELTDIPDEVYEDYGTPAKTPREDPFDVKNLSENARMLLAPKFRSNIDIRTSEASGTPTTSLNTLANSALLQQAIDDGNVPGVPKGTPLKNLLPGIGKYTLLHCNQMMC